MGHERAARDRPFRDVPAQTRVDRHAAAPPSRAPRRRDSRPVGRRESGVDAEPERKTHEGDVAQMLSEKPHYGGSQTTLPAILDRSDGVYRCAPEAIRASWAARRLSKRTSVVDETVTRIPIMRPCVTATSSNTHLYARPAWTKGASTSPTSVFKGGQKALSGDAGAVVACVQGRHEKLRGAVQGHPRLGMGQGLSGCRGAGIDTDSESHRESVVVMKRFGGRRARLASGGCAPVRAGVFAGRTGVWRFAPRQQAPQERQLFGERLLSERLIVVRMARGFGQRARSSFTSEKPVFLLSVVLVSPALASTTATR